MKNLINYFGNKSSVFVLVLFVSISLLLMNSNEVSTFRGVRIFLLGVVSKFSNLEHKMDTLKDHYRENQELRQKNLKLSLNNLNLQSLVSENIRLRQLLRFRESSRFNFVAANVIGSGMERTIRSLIIDAGLQQGVRKNYAVVTNAGLVGRILEITDNQAIVQILMDGNSRISARLQNSREVGIVGWSGNLWLDLHFISKDVELALGENVLTSGLSENIPAGIKIGVVADIQDDDYGMFKKIKVKNAVNYSRLEEVFVMIPSDSLNTEKMPNE